MSEDTSIQISLGDKNYTITTLNLNQQRAIGSALFSVNTPADLKDFDFDAEFDSAVAIVFAAVSLVEPEKDKAKWLSGIKITWRDLQQVKAQVLRFAGYLRAESVPAAAAPSAGAQAAGEPQPAAD